MTDTATTPVVFYRDDAVTLYHGDAAAVLATLPRADHVITDPPYSTHTHAKQWIGAALTADGRPRVSTAFTELGFDPLTTALRDRICADTARTTRRWSLVFCDVESIGQWRDAFTAAGLDYVRALIWDKVDSAPQFTGDRPAAGTEAIVVAHPPGKKRWNGGGRRNVLRHAVNGTNRGAKPHPSTKPESLMCELIALFTDPDDLILDPFAGSGTTLVACKRLGRRAIGIEMNADHCATAAARLRQGALSLTMPTVAIAASLFDDDDRTGDR